MSKRKPLVCLLLMFTTFSTIAQKNNVENPSIKNSKGKTKNKGKVFFYWGWNTTKYSDSDIHFSGDNYDFTIHDAKARDRMTTPIGFNKYLNPRNMTIPQTNARLGYYFHDNWNASIGLDHMKYVMTQFQTARISGNINITPQDEGMPHYNGLYKNSNTVLYEDFVTFEHTDGLNYVHLEVARVDNLGDYIGLNPKIMQINVTEGLSAGVLIPKTNAKILNKERHDKFHLSGYGVSVKGGINLTFFNCFFIQAELKGGFIDMPNIRTTYSKSDKAKQHFFFLQQNITIGGTIQLF